MPKSIGGILLWIGGTTLMVAVGVAVLNRLANYSATVKSILGMA